MLASGHQQILRRPQIDRDNRILVAPQHALYDRGSRVPELHGAVSGPGDDPSAVGGNGDGENEVLWREGGLVARGRVRQGGRTL